MAAKLGQEGFRRKVTLLSFYGCLISRIVLIHIPILLKIISNQCLIEALGTSKQHDTIRIREI